jgi:excisionase family DNA binding protein
VLEERNVLNPKQASAYLGCSESVMRLWRSQGQGPRYFRAGKLIRYRRADLDAWIEARICEPGSGSNSAAPVSGIAP